MGAIPDKGALQADFNAEKPAAGLMYHAIPVAPDGDEIRTSINYGMEIKPEILTALGVTDTDHPPLVFASTFLTKALAFGLNGFKGEKLLNGSIPGTNDELVLVTSRETTMTQPREGRVYAFSSEGFVDLPYADRQGVSKTPVKFSDAQVVLEIKSADDLMRAGLQILSFAEGGEVVRNDKKLEQFLSGKQEMYGTLRELIKEGRLVWENQARGINPNPVLAEKLGISLSSRNPKPVANTR